jgi:hypothetical protein
MMEVDVRDALWGGRFIRYRPGRLMVALERGVSNRDAYDYLVREGCGIKYESNASGVVEVVVSPKNTLRMAVILGTSPLFRYVEPDILEKESID